MVIQLFIMYIICVACLATFLMTREALLNPSDGEVTRREKILYSLNLNGLLLSLLYTPFLLFMVATFSLIGNYDAFITDVFSPLGLIMNGFIVFTNLGIGYSMNPQESPVPRNRIWVLLPVLLLLVVGILGIVNEALIYI